MSKFGIAALAVVVALIASVGLRTSTPTAQAAPDATNAVWCPFLAGGIDGDPDDAAGGADIAASCDGITAAEVALLGDGIGDEDGTLESSDLDEAQAFGANQISDAVGASLAPLNQILIFAFVDNNGAVTFDADSTASVTVNDDGTAGEAAPPDDGNPETCDGDDDADCGTTVPNDGDGVVVANITNTSADPGEEIDVDVSQDGTSLTETLTVVGLGEDVTLTLVESTIETDADDSVDCTDSDDLAVTDSDALSNTDSTIAIAVVSDDDGTAVTRELVSLTTDDADVADLGANTLVTVDAGDSGLAFFAVVCGQDDTGTATLTATGGGEDTDAEITVVGPPANVTLAASPAQIACDGTQTSTVTATVTDADGNNVANGTGVTFSVVALGTANPINTTTTDGAASSTVTPLSGATAGVTVIVSAGDASASIRVDCSLPVPTATPVGGASATPTTGVRPPDTGTGGFLGQDSSAGFPLWTLLALALGSFALVAGGMVTRRAGR